MIAQRKYEIREDEKSIADLQKSISQTAETLKDPPSYLTEEVKKALADGVTKTEKTIDQIKDDVRVKQQKINEYESMITGMSAEEAASPVRLDENKSIPDFDDSKRLVPPGRMAGVGLYKINPHYYDSSSAASGAQLIFVYYKIPNLSVFEKTEFNYLEKMTMDIFNHIDYHQLKKSMQ